MAGAALTDVRSAGSLTSTHTLAPTHTHHNNLAHFTSHPQVENGSQNFLPRLGGPLVSIRPSPVDPARYLVSQADNTLRVVNTASMKVRACTRTRMHTQTCTHTLHMHMHTRIRHPYPSNTHLYTCARVCVLPG